MCDSYCTLAELRRLGNTSFVNSYDWQAPGCPEHAVSAINSSHTTVVEMLMSCGASPRKQGSTWAGFLRAATSFFASTKAALIHKILKQQPTFEARPPPFKGWHRN